MISLEGLNKGDVLAALYNASRPLGMGFLHYDPTPMTRAEAEKLLSEYTYFDYLKGRVMKIDLEGSELDPRLYDRDNGQGAAERAIAAIADIATLGAIHQEGLKEAAEQAKDSMATPSSTEDTGKMRVFTMTLSDVADKVGPAVDRALGKTE